MDITIKILIVLIMILFNALIFKDRKNVLIVGIISILGAGTFANVLISQIPLPTEEITITALNKKNSEAVHYEVVLNGYEYEGKMIPVKEIKDGKWMYTSHQTYMWRDPSDIRQPDGLTNSITFDIPVGMDRSISLAKNKWSGIAEIKTENETQIVDLYKLESGEHKVSLGDSERKE